VLTIVNMSLKQGLFCAKPIYHQHVHFAAGIVYIYNCREYMKGTEVPNPRHN